jgi:hypothetical protein
MLSQEKADELLALPKRFPSRPLLEFPAPGAALTMEVEGVPGGDKFLIDANRRGGRFRLAKCSYLERYQVSEILLRLDLEGPPHANPDGTEMECPHLHVYREGYGDRWAFEVPSARFRDLTDLAQTLRDFLAFCGVDGDYELQRPLF